MEIKCTRYSVYTLQLLFSSACALYLISEKSPLVFSGQILMELTPFQTRTSDLVPLHPSDRCVWGAYQPWIFFGITGKEKNSSQRLPKWCVLGLDLVVAIFLYYWQKAKMKTMQGTSEKTEWEGHRVLRVSYVLLDLTEQTNVTFQLCRLIF